MAKFFGKIKPGYVAGLSESEMNLQEMRLAAARQEVICNAQVLASIDKCDAAKIALKEAKRYVKQCKEEVRAAIEAKADAVETAKALGVSLVESA